MKKSIAWQIAVLLSLFLAACGTLEVGVEADLSATLESTATSKPSAALPTDWPQAETPTLAFTPTLAPETETPSSRVVYTGEDDNIWLLDASTGENSQVTTDAVSMGSAQQSGVPAIRYCCALWSSDGQRLAFQRETGIPIPSGFDVTFDLMVYDIPSGLLKPLVSDEQITGFAWQPGTALVTYGRSIPFEYFLNHDQAPALALGIWTVDAETGETSELVKPERGFSLGSPRWSQDGRFLSFEEVQGMEGRGLFAYYDFGNQQYISWDVIAGSYDWSPDGEQIAYDKIAYVPQGGERIWLQDRQKSGERAFSPQFDPGYSFSPHFSPDGKRLAYLTKLGGPENQAVTVFVQALPAGQVQELGTFVQAGYLSWSPDGSTLLLTAGDANNRQVMLVDPATKETQNLAPGSQAAWQPNRGTAP